MKYLSLSLSLARSFAAVAWCKIPEVEEQVSCAGEINYRLAIRSKRPCVQGVLFKTHNKKRAEMLTLLMLFSQHNNDNKKEKGLCTVDAER